MPILEGMPHILIVDDNPLCRLSIRAMLEAAGHRTRDARNGHEAIEEAGRELPDLVLLDVLMPEKDGFETLLHFRKSNPSLPIVMISDGGTIRFSHALETARHFGADATLSKPFTAEELNAAIEQALHSSHP